jgi:hypothetical protein
LSRNRQATKEIASEIAGLKARLFAINQRNISIHVTTALPPPNAVVTILLIFNLFRGGCRDEFRGKSAKILSVKNSKSASSRRRLHDDAGQSNAPEILTLCRFGNQRYGRLGSCSVENMMKAVKESDNARPHPGPLPQERVKRRPFAVELESPCSLPS